MARILRACFVCSLPLVLGCRGEVAVPTVEVTNPLDVARGVETVELPWAEVMRALSLPEDLELLPEIELVLFDRESGQQVTTQKSDLDGDGKPEALLFQVSPGPGEKLRYILTVASEGGVPEPERRTFGRFVPERSDDFAWENDLVAFRMYGPALAADAVNSGVDCWLKRVTYPIIDKWYEENASGQSYHEDRGEGYDPYHVGASRGCGGLAIWHEGQLAPSNVFATWKVLENGPIRTTFELTYEPWMIGGKKIEERKRISIDLGSRLSRFQSSILVDGETAPLTVAIGLTTHDGVADAIYRMKDRWLRCWEESDGSGLGTGVVLGVEPKGPVEIDEVQPDTDHLVWIAPLGADGTITWYAGYGWERAGEITTVEDWERYLSDFAAALRSPLVAEVVEDYKGLRTRTR